MMRILPALILQTGLSITAHADTTASIEIQSLIQAVADSNCEFDRNGNLYSAENAAEHLELKYARGKHDEFKFEAIDVCDYFITLQCRRFGSGKSGILLFC